jgi:type I restriction enzyme M protein
MPRGRKPKNETTKRGVRNGTARLEEKLWAAADRLRSHMDAAEYKHVALGLIFLKYISDSFFERYKALQKEENADPEDRDEYTAENVFWVPKEARWPHLQANATQPTIGKLVDEAMMVVEGENPPLKGVLPKDYARGSLDKVLLGGLINLIGTIELKARDEDGLFASESSDILGRVYEYFLGRFAEAEGKRGGQYYTPASVVRLLVAILEPYKGRVYDPCCGSGGMFVQSEKFIEAHGGRKTDISIFGQESNHTTWRLARMDLAIRGIEANLGDRNADSFRDDLHRDLKADFILANPPFNMSDWGGDKLRDDIRWKRFGTPPASNANFAWVLHFIHHLAPRGMAGFVLASGSMSSNQSGEGEIRQKIIEADLVDCMVALPPQLFYTTQIPACLWFLCRDKSGGRNNGRRLRDRRAETLFIDARRLGTLIDRVHRELTDDDIAQVADTYHAWRSEGGTYADVPGFAKSATIEDIRSHGFVLTPGRYVGAAEADENDVPFEERFAALRAKLEEQFAEGQELQTRIADSLSRLVNAR